MTANTTDDTHRAERRTRTVRELGGEIWAELFRHVPDDGRLAVEVRNEIIDLIMGVLARYDGAVIENDEDLPVEPLPRVEELQR